MHKKDRPMLSVTALLYSNQSFTQQQQPNNSINNNNNNFNTCVSPTSLSNNGLPLTPTPDVLGNSNSLVANNCDNSRYPPNHPLSGSKHLCAICEDRASGKHYGVYSCEGCKGFFKRTVRKNLTYVCRDERNCIVDKRQRNRCQYCRYQKCLDTGMKREAVQEERQRNKPDNEVESSTGVHNLLHSSNQPTFQELTVERLLEAEKQVEMNRNESFQDVKFAIKEIELLFRWIRLVPYFTSLPLEDQVMLLKTGWNELLIAELSYRSICSPNRLILANGMAINKEHASTTGINEVFERVLTELVAKMREMKMDRSELSCLRAIVLFNPAIKSLKDAGLVERLRDRIYTILENHCRIFYHDKTSRFAKLLVRLPALRSIGLKCVGHLFFSTFLQEAKQNETIDSFITKMLEMHYD